jgi:hypothetical protein
MFIYLFIYSIYSIFFNKYINVYDLSPHGWCKKHHLHWVGEGSSKGTKVAIQQHVASLRPMVDE